MSTTIRIDLRDFITGPFFKCPKCGGNEFGVLSIYNDRYMRRCRNRECWYTTTLPLPALRKKVIYIDQCAISNIMMVLSPEVKGHERAVAEPFWSELYDVLDVVRHLQVAVCPDSTEHEHESLASPFFGSLKNTYEHFSGGLSFERDESIKMKQIGEAARCFIRKEELKFDLDPQRIVRGHLHGWQDRIRISVDGVLPGTLEGLRNTRSKVQLGIQEVFEEWQKGKRSFEEVFEQERGAYAPFIARQYVADQEKMARAIMGNLPLSLDAFMPSTASYTIAMVKHIFDTEAAPAKPAATVKDFLDSGLLKEVPFNVIASSMFASLARKAAAGQKEPPNQGTSNDIDVVSTLLPYCDAMFVDNGCRALLQDIPKKHNLPYPCRVFSKNVCSEFLKYLGELRDAVTPEHLEVVKEVYGPNPLKAGRGISGVGEFQRKAQAK